MKIEYIQRWNNKVYMKLRRNGNNILFMSIKYSPFSILSWVIWDTGYVNVMRLHIFILYSLFINIAKLLNDHVVAALILKDNSQRLLNFNSFFLLSIFWLFLLSHQMKVCTKELHEGWREKEKLLVHVDVAIIITIAHQTNFT